MQQHGSKYFAHRHTVEPHGGVKRSNHFFTESSHVAYQIKGNLAKSTVKANILSIHTASIDPWGGVKCQFFFLKVVILYIKLK